VPRKMKPSLPTAMLLPAVLLSMLASACGPTGWEDRTAAGGPGPTDGTYKGRAELVSATGPDCPAPRPGIISVGDQRLFYSYGPNENFVARIGPDGTLLAYSGQGRLEGRIGDGILQFNVRTPGCESRYALRWTM